MSVNKGCSGYVISIFINKIKVIQEVRVNCKLSRVFTVGVQQTQTT